VTDVADHGLLDAGTLRVRSLTSDEAVLAALLDVELAWAHALVDTCDAPTALPAALEKAAGHLDLDTAALAAAAEAGGNPVIPLVRALKDAVGQTDPDSAEWVHRGLTSQDALDSALMLVAARTLDRLHADLVAASSALARLAQEHRETVMVARTLAQHALPTTFGAKAAGWLEAVLDARERVVGVRATLPVQCGGAAGTLALAELLTRGRTDDLATAFAARLGLVWPGSPWHTRRSPVTGLGDALATVTDALSKVAADVVLLSRPEVGELSEPAARGRGGSSTMPQKRNPVLSVLIRSVALQAPHLVASLHTSAALAVDERPDGAWHAEWPVLRRLLQIGSGAAALGAELLDGLEVHADAMAVRLEQAGPLVLAERLQAELPARLGGGPDAVGQVKELLERAGAAADPRAVLRDGIPVEAVSDHDLETMLDPRRYLGVTEDLVDRAVQRAARVDAAAGAATAAGASTTAEGDRDGHGS
jgi:3-carboxy-cis,cis-muconate cycloisomerase